MGTHAVHAGDVVNECGVALGDDHVEGIRVHDGLMREQHLASSTPDTATDLGLTHHGEKVVCRSLHLETKETTYLGHLAAIGGDGKSERAVALGI